MAKGTDRDRAKEFLLANPQATNKDAAASVGVSVRTIGYARAELVNAGHLPPSWGDHKSPVAKGRHIRTSADVSTQTQKAAEGTPFDTESTADLNAAVAAQTGTALPLDFSDIEDEEIDIGRLKRILWRIARTDPDNRIRTQAIWTLTRIQHDMEERPPGPGAPRTKAEIVARFLDMFDAVGPAVVIEAMQAFLDKRKGTSRGVETVDSGDAAQTYAGPAGTADDDSHGATEA